MKLSVCVPTWHGEAFLGETIRSILAQTFQDFELMIVDDASGDATLEVAHAFLDSRISIFRNQQPLGIPGNWNRCLAKARGEYLTLFHQDDVMYPDNLARKVAILDADPTVSFVHSAVSLIVEDSAPYPCSDWVESSAEDFIVDGAPYFRKLLFQGNRICAPSVVTRRQRLTDLGGFNEKLRFACDYEIWMKLCVDSRVAFLSEPLIGYRWHARNATHQFRYEQGVEECLSAGCSAAQYYLDRTGQTRETEILLEAAMVLAEQRRWATELNQAKTWQEEQSQSWQRVAGEREQTITELRAWVAQLETAKTWQEEQSRSWQRVAGEREEAILAQRQALESLQRRIALLEQEREGQSSPDLEG